MKKLFKFFIIAMLAVCGVACEQFGGTDNGGNENNGENGNGNSGTTTLVVSVTNITATGATVSVTPSTDETYYFDVIEKDYFDAYTSEEQFIADYVADLKAMINDINSAYGTNYSIADLLSSGSDSYTYEEGSLEPNYDYYAFAFCLSANGEIKSGLTKKAFKTLSTGGNTGGDDVTTSNNTFNVDVTDITSTGAMVSVVPSNYDTYYFDVIEKEVYDMYTDKKEFAAEYIAEIKALFEAYGYSIGEILSSGNDAYSFEGYLEPNTAYYAFAVGVSTSGVITTDVAAVPFTTLAWGGGNSGGSTGGDKDLTCFELGYYENWGDYYGTNATNWYIDFYSMTSNDYFVVELQGDLSETAPVAGEYKILSTCAPGTAVAGGIDADGYGYGTFWALIHDSGEYLVDKVFCTSGTVKVSKSGDLYNIDVDAVGENGESVKMSYAGVLEEWVEEYSLSAQKLSNGLNKRFCTVSRLMKQKQVKMAPKTVLKKQAHSIVKLTPKKVAPKSSLIKRNIVR